MRGVIAIAIAGMVCSHASSAHAQDGAPARGCELRVFPSDRPIAAGTALGAALGSGTSPQAERLKITLDEQGQITQMRTLDLVGLLGLPVGTRITYHADEDGDALARTDAPATDGEPKLPSCLYDLRIAELIFNRHPLYGTDILTILEFRAYGSDGRVRMSASHRERSGIHDFPRVEEANYERIATMMNTAFLADVQSFVARIRLRLAARPSEER